MSHTTTLKAVAIRSIPALMAAVAALKSKGIDCELVENAKPRMYYSDQGEVCEYVLKLHDSKYDVGFQKQADGTYAPVFDEYQRYVANQIGADVNVCPMPSTREGKAQHQIGQLMQEYTKAQTILAAVNQGYVVDDSTVDAEGNVHLTISGMA